jgi:hypothetical protein
MTLAGNARLKFSTLNSALDRVIVENDDDAGN